MVLTERLKTILNIYPMKKKLEDFILNLKPVMYTLKTGESHRHHLGFYAQDVSQNANATIGDVAIYQASVINQNENGEIIEGYYDPNVDDQYLNWVMNYSELIAPTIALLQKTVMRVKELENQVQQLTQPDDIPSV